MITDEFNTIKDTQESEIKIKGSAFIGIASPVQSREEAEQFLVSIQRKYFDATHHCYAYQTGYGTGIVFRYSDDGEPTGTAGKPIYHVITGHRLTNLIVVVTRYFGGTKLGTGGLSRAYSESASDVLGLCRIVTQIIYKTIRVQFPYDETNTVMRLIGSLECKIAETKYDTLTEMDVAVRAAKADDFCAQLIDMTRGKASILDNV